VASIPRLSLGPTGELLLVLLTVWAGLLAIARLPPGAGLTPSELSTLWTETPPVSEPTRRLASEAVVLAAGSGEPAPAAVDESPQRILMLGDSMLDGLLPRLADYAAENGHSLNAVIWYGSRTVDWARGSRLGEALRDYRPTFVVLVIGSSELTTRDIEKRSSAIRQILKTVGDRKLIWVGPPNWRTDTGLGAVLEREVGAKRYFRSAELSFERKRDGIHPTLAASQKWMDAVALWTMTQSATPIRLAPPQKTGAPRPNARVFTPPSP
jgi:lysophospholipase L1-like esterase